MAETAAHMVDHVFPCVPVRQWVISLPKRLRYFLVQDAKLASQVLRIILDIIEQSIRAHSPGAPPGARSGGVSYIHRFGAALNAHLHYHCCIIDGVFAETEEGLEFFQATALTQEAIKNVQERIRTRLLRLFVRKGVLDTEAAEHMLTWSHGGGFSLDAAVRISAFDRAGLERLLRYCARPRFAAERLEWLEDGETLIYHLPKPRPDGQTALILTTVQFLDRIAILIPPHRRHRPRYFGVLAPNAPLRPQVTERAGLPIDEDQPDTSKPSQDPPFDPDKSSNHTSTSYSWALLLARIDEILPLICPVCGVEMRIISFVTEPAAVQRILNFIGEPATPPKVAPARAPPEDESVDQTPEHDPTRADPIPEYAFDQTRTW